MTLRCNLKKLNMLHPNCAYPNIWTTSWCVYNVLPGWQTRAVWSGSALFTMLYNIPWQVKDVECYTKYECPDQQAYPCSFNKILTTVFSLNIWTGRPVKTQHRGHFKVVKSIMCADRIPRRAARGVRDVAFVIIPHVQIQSQPSELFVFLFVLYTQRILTLECVVIVAAVVKYLWGGRKSRLI